MDQAATLRDLMRIRGDRAAPAPGSRGPRMITVIGEESEILASALARVFSRLGSRASLDPRDPDCEFVFLNLGLNSGLNPELSAIGPDSVVVLELDSAVASLAKVCAGARLLRSRAGLERVNVVVNRVTDGREGRLVFQKLKDVARRSLDVQFEYLGHRERDEKVAGVVMNRGFLLDLKGDGLPGPALELVAKRLRMKCLDWAR